MNKLIKTMKFIKYFSFFTLIIALLNSCGGKLPGADASKFPPDPKKRSPDLRSPELGISEKWLVTLLCLKQKIDERKCALLSLSLINR